MKPAFVVILLVALPLHSQIPHTFEAGNVARADEVNANFQFLLGKMDSLAKRIESLETMTLPIGAVIASMKEIDTSGGIWVLADGRTATTAYFQATGKANVPDLRGMFLRGLNEGRDDGSQDPEGSTREAGDFQVDTLKSHSHLENLATGNGGCYSGGSYGSPNSIQTGLTGGAETRPRNCAVYWYVKVK